MEVRLFFRPADDQEVTLSLLTMMCLNNKIKKISKTGAALFRARSWLVG